MNVMFSAFTAPTSTIGAVTRMMALAKKFAKEGHTVNFCASGETVELLKAKGFTVQVMPESTIFGLPKIISNLISKHSYTAKLPAKEGKSYGNLWLFLYFSGHSNRRYLLECVKKQVEACCNHKTDLLVSELEPSAYLVAYILNKPLVTTYSAIAKKGEDAYFWNKAENSVNYVLKHFGYKSDITLHEIIYGKNIFKLIPSIPELEQTPYERNTCYCGNLLESVKKSSSNFTLKNGKKYIFCYFGTGSISHNIIEKELPKALADKDDIICYLATDSIKEDYSIGNVKFVNYINATKLLPHCILTLCHGGLNTITQSLEYGVPVLSFPGPIFERRFNSEMLQKAGVGYMGELSDFNASWIKNMLDIKSTLSQNLLRIQNRFKEYKGEDTAYAKINEWNNSLSAKEPAIF